MNVRLAIDSTNNIVLTDTHGNVVTTITDVSRWVDHLIHMKVMQEVNEAFIAGGDDVRLGREGVAL